MNSSTYCSIWVQHGNSYMSAYSHAFTYSKYSDACYDLSIAYMCVFINIVHSRSTSSTVIEK